MFRKVRNTGRGGGVPCIFIKSNITYKIKENEFVKNVEYIHVQFVLNNKQFTLINIYNPGEKIKMNIIYF